MTQFLKDLMKEGLLTGMIAIDLQKAFDTFDHEILLSKMPLLGFSNNTTEWFRSYYQIGFSM